MSVMNVRFKERPGKDGRAEYFAMIECEKCGSTFSSGEYMDLKEGRDIAVASLREHKLKWPHCKRPAILGGLKEESK